MIANPGGIALAMAILLPLLTAPLVPLTFRIAPRHGHWWLALSPLLVSALLTLLLTQTIAGEPANLIVPWVPALGISLSLHGDGLGLFYGLLISGIGTLVVLYAGGYMAGDDQRQRLFVWLLLFMGAMLGVALADNLMLLFFFWELTTFSSFMLIGVHHEEAEAQAAARQALMITGAGGLVLLTGLLLLAEMAGSFQLSTILTGPDLREHPLYSPTVVLLLIGAASKSALVPFHSWLPQAMVAPTPVSAYLHAATMVKAGIYLLLRLQPSLGDTPLWQWGVGGVGAVTMVYAATLAPLQTDLKALLAYATLSVLGLLTLLTGIGSADALKAALTFMAAHALYKGALFFAAGSIDHATGTRNVNQLNGLARLMPWTAAATALAAASMAAMPPWFGFIAKEKALEVTLHLHHGLGALVAWSGLCFVVAALVMAVSPFRYSPDQPRTEGHEVDPAMVIGSVILGAAGLLLGLLPDTIAHAILTPAATAFQLDEPLKLALWHGVNLTLIVSLATLGIGGLLFLMERFWLSPIRPLQVALGTGYQGLLKIVFTGAGYLAQLFRRGNLASYLTVVLLTLVTLQGGLLLDRFRWMWPQTPLPLRTYEVGAVLLTVVCLGAVMKLSGRLTTIVALGATGYSISLLYSLYGAPDLAMVQFLIESLTAILFAVAFNRLDPLTVPDGRYRRLGHGLLATAGGVVMTGLVWLALTVERGPRVSRYFAEHSVPEAHAHNVVNAIVVEFRALDTLGEIAVLTMAALGGLVLISEGRWRERQ